MSDFYSYTADECVEELEVDCCDHGIPFDEICEDCDEEDAGEDTYCGH